MNDTSHPLPRSKALFVAAAAAGAIVVSAAAAALSLGVLDEPAHKPLSIDSVVTTTTGVPADTTTPTVVEYQDVYEHVPAPATPSDPVASPTAGTETSDDHESVSESESDDDSSAVVDGQESDSSDDSAEEPEHEDSSDEFDD